MDGYSVTFVNGMMKRDYRTAVNEESDSPLSMDFFFAAETDQSQSIPVTLALTYLLREIFQD